MEKNLEEFSKEELISLVKSLKAHNKQLQNLIAKGPRTESQKPKKPFNFENCKFRHILLKFFYLGWDYNGYVVQEDTPHTIENYLFQALTKTCLIKERASANYHRCGRTDKGVSSFSQVISLDVRSISDDPETELNYCKILNSVLPPDIQCVSWAPVKTDFSARFNCKSRTYKYFFPKSSLDIEAMKKASKYLEGTHDFRNFCKMDVNNGVVEFIRNVISIDINSLDDDINDFSIFVLTIKGNAFLWHQIRCIISVLILIGEHKEDPEIIKELLDVEKNPRKPEYQMASEVPLNLYDCEYENINWVQNKESLDSVHKKLYNFWSYSSIRTKMVETMMNNIGEKTVSLSNILIPGAKPKNYVPLMKRQLSTSLETKIQNSKKKRKY